MVAIQRRVMVPGHVIEETKGLLRIEFPGTVPGQQIIIAREAVDETNADPDVPLNNFYLAVTCRAALMSEAVVSTGTVFSEADRSYFEVVSNDGTKQVIVQDAKAANDAQGTRSTVGKEQEAAKGTGRPAAGNDPDNT